MLFGNKKNIANILPYISEDLQKALQYIATTDFTKVENGEYEIVGKEIFATVNTYLTEPRECKKPESHNEYIDVQYLGSGEETIYFESQSREHIVTEDYAKERDLLFYKQIAERNCAVLQTGDFVVLFPWELHRPGCNAKIAAQSVQKIVVKVRRKKL